MYRRNSNRPQSNQGGVYLSLILGIVILLGAVHWARADASDDTARKNELVRVLLCIDLCRSDSADSYLTTNSIDVTAELATLETYRDLLRDVITAP